MAKSLQSRIDDTFLLCSAASPGTVDFLNVAKLFWPVLDNKISLVDLVGIYTMAMPTHTPSEGLDSSLFFDVFSAVSKLKYPTGREFCEKMLDDLRVAKPLQLSENSLFEKCTDKNVMRSLLRFDIPLRRAFASYAGKSISVGGGVTWEEVKRLNLGMEIDGFSAFCGAFSIIPAVLELKQCETLAKEITVQYPLHSTASAFNPLIIFPQFQLLLCSVALESFKMKHKVGKTKSRKEEFAKKTVDTVDYILADLVADLLRDIGIDKTEKSLNFFSTSESVMARSQDASVASPARSVDLDGSSSVVLPGGLLEGDGGGSMIENSVLGTVTMPTSENAQDKLFSSGNQNRQAMLMRMEYLMDEIETTMLQAMGAGSEVLAILSAPTDEVSDTRSRSSNKPVVIADAIPIPDSCPEMVEQLLEAALAHHNLASFAESLKFLEAARLQLEDILKRKSRGETVPMSTLTSPFELEMYIIICKGNVYQSCGDDEQALLQYMDGWTRAKTAGNHDWEIVCLNSIGMLAYYNLRYDVGLMCFSAVNLYRTASYGAESPDTASAANNEACCLFCLNKRGEARVRFERSWNVLCSSLGHRSPRCVTVWKNLEKARRSHGSMHGSKNIKDSVEMRQDANKLLYGSEFFIRAVVPSDGKKKKGKKGKKKK